MKNTILKFSQSVSGAFLIAILLISASMMIPAPLRVRAEEIAENTQCSQADLQVQGDSASDKEQPLCPNPNANPKNRPSSAVPYPAEVPKGVTKLESLKDPKFTKSARTARCRMRTPGNGLPICPPGPFCQLSVAIGGGRSGMVSRHALYCFKMKGWRIVPYQVQNISFVSELHLVSGKAPVGIPRCQNSDHCDIDNVLNDLAHLDAPFQVGQWMASSHTPHVFPYPGDLPVVFLGGESLTVKAVVSEYGLTLTANPGDDEEFALDLPDLQTASATCGSMSESLLCPDLDFFSSVEPDPLTSIALCSGEQSDGLLCSAEESQESEGGTG